MTLGFDTNDMPVLCDAGYDPYHEVGMCILPRPSPDFIDCAHDMNSVGSQCFRCLRYYGKTGTDACFKCYANCLMCAGPNSDQCTYCGQGYGFTGISCKKCQSDEAWDLSKNLCQLKKDKYLEIDYEFDSFGEVQLLFVPLNGYADLSLYYEYMFGKYWLIDINRNYEFSRTYTNLPLHRKVSISFELMQIDTRHFEPLTWSVDGYYLGFLQWNLEDIDMNCTTSFWGYNQDDMLPTKFSHTLFHSSSSMVFQLKNFFQNDWGTVWIRELNVTFFGCFESCATCWEDNSPVHCLTCLPGYYFTNYQCKACSSQCSTCINDPYTCTGCPSSQVLLGSSCIAGCGLGFFSDSNSVCQACPATCIQCNSLTSCITCVNGNYLNGASQCVACSAPCSTCITTATTCLSCSGALLLQDNTCVASCSTGYYQIGTSTCQKCPTGCTTCDSVTCTACDPGYRFKGTICANPCGNGWYASSATTCSQCMSQCLTCSDGTSCDSCKPGFVTAACIPCTAPCLTCSGTPTSCTACYPGSAYYLQYGGGSCVDKNSCAAGSYAETNNQCMACSSECATCVDYPTKCLTCSNPSDSWKDYKCLGACSTGYINIGGLCCPDKCTGCDQTEKCSGCVTGYFLDGDGVCLPCDSNCATCQTTSTYCLTCSAGKVLQSNVCKNTCDDKFYNDGGVCKPCDSTCGTCTGPANTECTSCENLHVSWNGLCHSCSNSQPDFENSRFEEKGGRCWEKCGVGGKLTFLDIPEGLGGYKSCDDGNLVNGDGCSASCTVEKNYNCVGGSVNKKDYCHTLVKPIAYIVPINNSSDFQIIFSKKVSFRDVNDQTNDTSKVKFPISLDIHKLDTSQYTVKWTRPSGFETDYVNFSITPVETIRDKIVTVYFDRQYILGRYNNSLSTIKLRVNATIIVDKRFIFEPVYSVFQTSNQFTKFIVPASSLGITNYVLQSFIRYMMTFQIIGAGIFYNVNQTSYMSMMLSEAYKTSQKTLPGPSYAMKTKLVVDKNDNLLDKRIRIYNRRLLETNSTAQNTSAYAAMYDTSDAPLPFMRNGYTNAFVPNLSFSIAVILIASIWYFLASFFLIGKVTVRDNCFKKFLAFNAERCFYTAMIFGTLELSIFSTTNLMNPKFDHPANILSFIVSFFALLIVLLMPIIIYKIANHAVFTLWHPEYYDRYGFIYCEFKLDTNLRKVFMSVILLRVVAFGIASAALVKIPIAQTVVIFLIHFCYYATLLKTKPFVSMVMHFITVIAEFFVLASSACFIISAIDNSKNILSSDTAKETVDVINCICIMLAIFFTLIGVIMMIVLKLIQWIKKKASQKKYQSIAPVKSSAKELSGSQKVELIDTKRHNDIGAGSAKHESEKANAGDDIHNNSNKNERPQSAGFDEDDFLGEGNKGQTKFSPNDFEDDFLNTGNNQRREIKDEDF